MPVIFSSTPKHNTLSFGDLGVNTLFYFQGYSNDIFLKVDEPCMSDYFALNLTTGLVNSYDKERIVGLYEGSVTINNDA